MLGLIGPVGLPELIVILVIILLLFGARKLPEMAKALGKSINEFKNASKEGMKDSATDEKDKASSSEEGKPNQV
jgi:sec-independent protein translocase protein TatA